MSSQFQKSLQVCLERRMPLKCKWSVVARVLSQHASKYFKADPYNAFESKTTCQHLWHTFHFLVEMGIWSSLNSNRWPPKWILPLSECFSVTCIICRYADKIFLGMSHFNLENILSSTANSVWMTEPSRLSCNELFQVSVSWLFEDLQYPHMLTAHFIQGHPQIYLWSHMTHT